MAMIDYGALLKINGNFINKNKGMFMDMQEAVGFVLEVARYNENDFIDINDNFYVYAGSKDLLLCFYKTYFYVIRNGEIIKKHSGSTFNSETLFADDVHIKVKHLDNEWLVDKAETNQDYKEEMSKEKWLRYVKRIGEMNRKRPIKYKTNRYIASWKHNGNKYEVIFGYGIDPNEEVWNDIKFKSYGFTDKERTIIDEWFA
jgi:hypothetical protein